MAYSCITFTSGESGSSIDETGIDFAELDEACD